MPESELVCFPSGTNSQSPGSFPMGKMAEGSRIRALHTLFLEVKDAGSSILGVSHFKYV